MAPVHSVQMGTSQIQIRQFAEIVYPALLALLGCVQRVVQVSSQMVTAQLAKTAPQVMLEFQFAKGALLVVSQI